MCFALVSQYHAEAGLPYDDAHRAGVIAPLLEGSPLGAIWLLGPVRSPLGYVLVTFDWSVAAGGMTGWVAEMFVRDKVRGRGIGTESLHAVAKALRSAGVKALHVDLGAPEAPVRRFWTNAGFRGEATRRVLTDKL